MSLRPFLSILVLLVALPTLADDVIIAGSGGDDTYRDRFADWGSRLEAVLTSKLGRKAEAVHLFTEKEGAKRSEIANLNKLFKQLKGSHRKEDTLFIYLIGHGSYLRGEARFQIPGDDLSPPLLDAWIKSVPAKNVVIINASSASAPFINELSAPGRIICSATKSGSELNATEFMGFFLRALEEDKADRDHDERISVWEAARFASAQTRDWYSTNGLIATEHAILDDNADALGTRLVQEVDPLGIPKKERNAKPDGDLARTIFIQDFIWPDTVPKPLIERYLAQVEKARAVIARKKSMSKTAFQSALEKEMLAAARLHQQIKEYSNGNP